VGIQYSFLYPNSTAEHMSESISFRRWLFVLAAVSLIGDLGSKYLVFGWLYGHPRHYDPVARLGSYELIPGAFRLHTQYVAEPAVGWLRRWNAAEMPHVNQGALFGLGNEHSVSNAVFAAISLLAAGAITIWGLRRTTVMDGWISTALGLILGGTLGNFFDRVVFGGVRDFLYWYKLIDWPVFNIADCCLVVGASFLLVHAFLTSPSPTPIDHQMKTGADGSPAGQPAPITAPSP